MLPCGTVSGGFRGGVSEEGHLILSLF
jgi:hypothetical protein